METRIGMNEPLASFLRIERAGADAWTTRLADLGWGKALGGDWDFVEADVKAGKVRLR